MSSFSRVLEVRSRIPERHVVLRAESFADEWPDRPKEGTEIAFGLRRIADADVQTARAEAAKLAADLHQDLQGQIEAFNDGLMRWAVTRALTDANDVALPAPMFGGMEENVRLALTPQAVRYVWDELEKFHVETSPIVAEATDDELRELAQRVVEREMLREVPLGVLTPGAIKRFRKLAKFLLEELREADPFPDEEEDELEEIDNPAEVSGV